RRYPCRHRVGRREFENVDVPEPLLHLRQAGSDRRVVQHIGADGSRDDTVVDEVGHDRVQLEGAARHERDPEAVRTERLRDRTAYSTGACTEDGDDRHGAHRTRTSGTADMPGPRTCCGSGASSITIFTGTR